jgi:aldehyde dehydrogenase (NAD+)
MDAHERGKLIYKLADLIEKNLEELAAIESVNNGKPWAIAKIGDLVLCHKTMRYYAGWPDKIRGHTHPIDGPFFAYTKKEPVGVVGQIIPWNVPLIMLVWKIAPALAAGCTIVLKSSEQTPLSAMRVAELINEAGFPPGVVNILNGYGDTGAYICQHPGIDKVAFTGSKEVGYKIMRGSHVDNIKRVTLELGGKSPNIITKHANLETALSQSTFALYLNAGQSCIAGSRTFVHESLYDEFCSKVVKCVAQIKVGDPLDPNTQQGPLNNKEVFDRVMGYIKKGQEEGAKMLCGGKRIGDKGFFIEPTVFCDVTDEMTIAKE